MKRSGPATPSRTPVIGPLLAKVREAGCDPEILIAQFGLPSSAETDREVAVPYGTLDVMLEAAERLTCDPSFAITLARSLPRGCFGLFEYLCRTAATVGESIKCSVRYGVFLNELVVNRFEETAGSLLVHTSVPGEPLCWGARTNELCLAWIVDGLRKGSGRPLVPERAWLPHAELAGREHFARVLGVDHLEFDAQTLGYQLSQEQCRLPIIGADPVLFAILTSYAEQLLAARRDRSRWIGHLRQTLRSLLSEGLPTLETTARALRISPRTLQRRIGAEQTSFTELLESERERLAREKLVAGGRSITEVAFDLQYSDVSTFSRAFKRWTGKSPKAFSDLDS
jgi:AraC-like DNA-binding protein